MITTGVPEGHSKRKIIGKYKFWRCFSWSRAQSWRDIPDVKSFDISVLEGFSVVTGGAFGRHRGVKMIENEKFCRRVLCLLGECLKSIPVRKSINN